MTFRFKHLIYVAYNKLEVVTSLIQQDMRMSVYEFLECRKGFLFIQFLEVCVIKVFFAMASTTRKFHAYSPKDWSLCIQVLGIIKWLAQVVHSCQSKLVPESPRDAWDGDNIFLSLEVRNVFLPCNGLWLPLLPSCFLSSCMSFFKVQFPRKVYHKLSNSKPPSFWINII